MNRELLQQALDALEVLLNEWTPAREAQIQGTPPTTALREALAAPAPADMVMVPREPTPEQITAGAWTVSYRMGVYYIAEQAYRAMIAAAPAPAVPLTDNDCTPNHLCNGRMVHLPRGEQCDRCGHE